MGNRAMFHTSDAMAIAEEIADYCIEEDASLEWFLHEITTEARRLVRALEAQAPES